MSDDFYQRQLREQQWRMQQDQQRQMQEQWRMQQDQQQWSDQQWRRDQDALRALHQQQAVEREQLLQEHDDQMQAQLREAVNETQRDHAVSSAGAPTGPLSPSITQPLVPPTLELAKADDGAQPTIDVDSAIAMGLDLLKKPSISTALPLIAVGVRFGVRWLAARHAVAAELNEGGTICKQCGGETEPSYTFCIHCGAPLV